MARGHHGRVRRTVVTQAPWVAGQVATQLPNTRKRLVQRRHVGPGPECQRTDPQRDGLLRHELQLAARASAASGALSSTTGTTAVLWSARAAPTSPAQLRGRQRASAPFRRRPSTPARQRVARWWASRAASTSAVRATWPPASSVGASSRLRAGPRQGRRAAMKSAMAAMSSRRNQGSRPVRWLSVRGNGDDVVLSHCHRLGFGTAHLDLGMCVALEALDQHQVGRRQPGQHFGQRRLPLFAHDGVARTGHQHHLGGAGGAMAEGIGAWLVDIGRMVGVLDRRHPPAAAHELGDQALGQRRLAGVLPAGDAEHELLRHAPLVTFLRDPNWRRP